MHAKDLTVEIIHKNKYSAMKKNYVYIFQLNCNLIKPSTFKTFLFI